jgi:RHS repeat-associated protein
VFDSFGNRTNADAIDAAFEWTGVYRDPVTGLQWNRARWYNPEIQRWMSEDPLPLPFSDENPGRYANNAPTMYVDPSGLSPPLGGEPQGKEIFAPTPFESMLYPPGWYKDPVFNSHYAEEIISQLFPGLEDEIEQWVKDNSTLIALGLGALAAGIQLAGGANEVFGTNFPQQSVQTPDYQLYHGSLEGNPVTVEGYFLLDLDSPGVGGGINVGIVIGNFYPIGNVEISPITGKPQGGFGIGIGGPGNIPRFPKSHR